MKIDERKEDLNTGKVRPAIRCTQVVPNKRLYSIKELVAEIGATEWFWRSQIWGGLLPFVQIGKKMFIDSNDIDSFIENHKKLN